MNFEHSEKTLTEQEIKRFLALLKAKAEYPERNINLSLPEGFEESFKSQPNFRGWINYHVTWEIEKNDPWVVILRKIPLSTEWHRHLVKLVPILPTK